MDILSEIYPVTQNDPNTKFVKLNGTDQKQPQNSYGKTCERDPNKFDQKWFGTSTKENEVFKDILKEHNRRRGFLKALREAVKKSAEDAAELKSGKNDLKMHDNGPMDILDALRLMYSGVYGFEKKLLSRTDIEKKLLEDKVDANVFDPWDGWWAGKFSNNESSWFNLHVWDPTFQQGDQYIQLVTQLVAKPGKWFASPTNLKTKEEEELKAIDYALNIWSKTDEITGWVRKPLMEIPHVGFRLDKETLLWVAVFEEKLPKNEKKSYFTGLFVERAYSDGNDAQRYVICGGNTYTHYTNEKDITFSPDKEQKKSSNLIIDQVNQQVGDYYGVERFKSREDLYCAAKKIPKETGNTPSLIIDQILKET